VLNRAAVEKAIRFGLAVGASINRRSVFARKNYFYPDLPKGYQISQYELPIVKGGEIPITSATRGEIKIRLTRAHLEEDAGKSLHEDFHGMTGIDLNRAGVPLLEIVSEPDMRSAEEAVAYAKALHSLVRWIDICDGNMQEGSFRCDANVSVRRPGAPLGTRCEIKNLNSFRFLEEAINYEARRQIELTADGGRVVQETRLYDPDRRETRSMRSKEDAHDYRYFPDPDLLPLAISAETIERIRSELPELPQAKRERYMRDHQLSTYDAGVLTSSREVADFYEDLISALGGGYKLAASWITGELFGALKRAGLEISQSPLGSRQLAGLLQQIQDKVISGKTAKDVFDAMWNGEGEAAAIIAAKGLKQISDAGELEQIIAGVLTANSKSVEEYKAGKEKAFNALVGQAMRATKGKGNPAQINEILKKKLTG